MPENTFKIEIVTPEGTILSQEAISLVVPGKEGYVGILANHTPIIAELVYGEVDIKNPDGRISRLAISGGFLQVTHNNARILADSAEFAEKIDVERAEEAKKRAEERLKKGEREVDEDRAMAALQRAINRIRVAGNHNGLLS